MIRLFHRLARNSSGAAAAEMALVTPLLLIIMFGSVELGNYFMNEHSLVKAVRDGARFAARQSFTSYPDCSTVGTSAQDATKNVVMYGYLSGSAVLTPNITTSDITVSTSCAASAGGQKCEPRPRAARLNRSGKPCRRRVPRRSCRRAWRPGPR